MTGELYEKKFKKGFYNLAVFTIIITIIWLGMVTYKAFTKSQIKTEVKKLLTPLTSTLDLDTMKEISQREVVPKADWDSLQPAQPVGLLVPPIPESTVSSGLTSNPDDGLNGQLE